MSILGTRVVRIEDPRFLTGEGTYIGNLPMPGALHLTFVRSSMAHARLISIDASEALSMPGICAVWTAADVDLTPAGPANGMMNKAMLFPYLAIDTVRYVGDLVAIVVSEDKTSGVDAAETVIVDYEPLPVVLDMDDSFSNRVLLHPDAETNVVLTFAARSNDDIFADCEVVVELVIENQRVAPAPMEVRACVSTWDGTRLTQWACSQGAHGARDGLAEVFGLEKSQVRVITPDVGGGFGAKSGVYPEEILVGWATRKLGVPVRWTESRTENMLAMGHGRAQRQRTRMGGTRDGRITAYRLDLLQDAGAYARAGAVLPYMTRMMAGGVYDIANVQFESNSVVTNTTPTVAYRGAGRPEATSAIERTIDEFARVTGIDPAEVRRRNYIDPSAFPLTTSMGAKYDSGEYAAALELALNAAGYDQLLVEQKKRRDSNDPVQIGIGIASYVETTNPMGSGDYGSVEIKADGGAIVRTGSSSHGQGHHTAWAMIVSQTTGIPMDKIEFRFGDTDDVDRGGGTGGSRSLQVGGSAAKLAAESVIEKARQRAADLMEAAVEDVVIDTVRGAFHVKGSPNPARTWAELMIEIDAPLEAEVDYVPEGATFPFGTHVCVVEVDIETGSVVVARHIACDDAGTIINPLLVDGQVHGGIAQGVAQALLEVIAYDPDGNPITSNLADYGFISAAELPSFERVPMETPTPRNPLGAKGIGEAGTIGSTPAVHNAVVNAVSHLGVTHIDMPCTSFNVWTAIQAVR
ncbi:MAG: xanthine dehydrogenase family protein molybdopterin-binding subunit [Ilumatobacteraceae bacterium]|nr:xanthine dehydrogenase family protein molybdopterin-binding subunit [Ilumatobacteraceae bacterium]